MTVKRVGSPDKILELRSRERARIDAAEAKAKASTR